MASLPDVMRRTHDTGVFEEVRGILFHGEAGFLATVRDFCREKDLSCSLLIKLSLGEASLWCLRLPALDVHAEKCVAEQHAITPSEGNAILYWFSQRGIQLVSGPHQNGSCISTRV